MARIEIIKYKCDVCTAEFDKEEDLLKDVVPCYGGERSEYLTTCKIDLCKSCAKKLRQVIYDNFAAVTDYYGLQITRKD